MYYRHKPQIVTAFEIIGVGTPENGLAEPGAAVNLTLASGLNFYCDSGMTARYFPVVGDYLVWAPQPDGGPDYAYLQPRAVFESKYEPADPQEVVTGNGDVHEPGTPGVDGTAQAEGAAA